MKKFVAIALAILTVFTFAACAQEQKPAEKADIKVAAIKGPTSMGMVKLMEQNEKGEAANNYDFTLAGSPDEIVGSIVKGEYDIAAVPTNLASVLYNKTDGKIKIMALNTLGVLYVVENGNSIQKINDLEGKTIYATGKGSTPEFALNYILDKNGIADKVTVEYKSEHTELAALLSSGKADIALLPQPFVTSAMANNSELRVALDLTEEWNKVAEDGSTLTMGCVIVQESFLKEHPEAVEAFLKEYEESVQYVTNAENIDKAAELIGSFDIIKAEVAKKALPECNIVYIDGDEMKTAVSGFLKVLFESDPTAVGGKLPDDGFYY